MSACSFMSVMRPARAESRRRRWLLWRAPSAPCPASSCAASCACRPRKRRSLSSGAGFARPARCSTISMRTVWDSIRSRWAPARISRQPFAKAPPSCGSAPPFSVPARDNQDHMDITAAFVGGGNMGGALVRGLIARGLPAERISVGEAHQARRIELADRLGVRVSADNREAVQGADVVVIAVKPQDMAGTVQPLADVFGQRRPVVISIAAGIRVADIERWSGAGIAVVRAMPNRPALNGAGATAMYAP